MILWLKALHIAFVVTWFAGLFYLPRLFVYHAGTADALGLERFCVMERRLLAIMTLGAALAILFGVAMVAMAPAYLHMHWLHAKLVLVAFLIGYHIWCRRLVGAFARATAAVRQGGGTFTPPRSERWLRWFNEAPALLLLAIVILAVVKP